MSSLRLVVLLSAASAALAAAGRLWLTALTPGAAPFIVRVEPDRMVWDRAAAIRAAPRLSELLAPAPRAVLARHKGHHAVHATARHRARPATDAAPVSYHHASAPNVQYATRTIPHRPVSELRPPTSPAPKHKPKPRTHAPHPTPTPKPKPAPQLTPVTKPAPTPSPAPPPQPAPAPQQPAPSVTPPPVVTVSAEPTQTTTVAAPATTPTPPATVTTPPITEPPTETRPGHGYGDKNHEHTGPPGQPQ